MVIQVWFTCVVGAEGRPVVLGPPSQRSHVRYSMGGGRLSERHPPPQPHPHPESKIPAEFVSPFTFLRGPKPFWIKEGNLTGRRLY